MKKQRTSNQLLKNYLLILFIPPLLSILAIIGLSRLDSPQEKRPSHVAEQLMQDDYTSIDTRWIQEEGGGMQVLDSKFQMLRSEGYNPFGTDALSPAKFVRSLMKGETSRYVTTYAYNEKEQFWLVVSVHNQISFSATTRIALNMQGVVIFALVTLVITLLSTFIYSKLTATRFVRPLRDLSEALRRVRNGDYSARVPVGNNREFSELELSFNHMAERIEQQIDVIEQSERNRKSLVLDISHDLKNPLTSIVGYSELLMKQQDPASPEQADYARIIYESSIRANELIMDLFELSRMDSPAFQLERTTDDFAEFIRTEMIRMLPELEAAGLSPEFHLPEEKLLLSFDKKAMRRVLSNLLYNTLSYHKTGSPFQVRLEKQADGIRLALGNDSAIDAPVRTDQWLEPFVREVQADSLNPDGSGLGLAIVKKIVAAHGGSVHLNTDQGAFEILIKLPQM
jgi:signal transduction histidine kinase